MKRLDFLTTIISIIFIIPVILSVWFKHVNYPNCVTAELISQEVISQERNIIGYGYHGYPVYDKRYVPTKYIGTYSYTVLDEEFTYVYTCYDEVPPTLKLRYNSDPSVVLIDFTE